MNNRRYWDEARCRQVLEAFYEREGRPPRHDELNKRHDLPCPTTLYTTFGTCRLEHLMATVLGTKPIAEVVAEYVWEKSGHGAKRVFYLNSHGISRETGVDTRKLGAYLRTANVPGMLVAGYQLQSITRSEGKRRTFRATRVSADPIRDI